MNDNINRVLIILIFIAFWLICDKSILILLIEVAAVIAMYLDGGDD